MEYILKEKAHSFELTDKYKVLMNGLLEKHYKKELSYVSWDKVKKGL